MPDLPPRPSLQHLRKQAKARSRADGVPLHRAQRDLAREYGFESWPRLVHHVRTAGLTGVERALVLADADALAGHVPVPGDLLRLLRHSVGTPSDVRRCAELLLDGGAGPDEHEPHDGWARSALFEAVERRDLALVRLLLDRGATPDEDAFYHACEQSDTALLDALYRPGYQRLLIHKLDFEDAAGVRWFLDRGPAPDGALHWAIGRGRGVDILRMLIDAGADVNQPHPQVGYRPLAAAARCGHLAAYELLRGLGATADLDPVDAAVLAVARGESARLPAAPPAMPGVPGHDAGWLLGQFALLGRTSVVRTLLDAGLAVDTRGWSNFTPLDQAAMHGRADTVALLIGRGADLTDRAAMTDEADDDGPTPLDCALWGLRNNRAADGDYPGTVGALVAAGAPTRHTEPTGDPEVDALLGAHRSAGRPR